MAALPNMNSGLLRRQQIERYHGSPFDMAPATPRNPALSKFKFQKECVFLAACLSEDMDEVKKLLGDGVDIDAANIDGLTALHQACIYSRMEMVKFLIAHSADVNVCDNDGWTPLHAACSNGFIDIARFLINNGSKVDSLSFDGELPIDVAEGEEMHQLLSDIMEKNGIDAERAKKQEEERMLADAKHWLTSGTYSNSLTHPKSGASPLHVAAARGYVSVIWVLLQAGANINAQDLDGWTPLHAAAHWGHRDACQLLVENLCDVSIEDSFGLLAQDVADPEFGNFIEELQKKQMTLYSEIRNSKRASFAGRKKGSISRLSFDQKQMMLQKSKDEERTRMEMMLARRSGRINSADKMNTQVFGVEEEKEGEEEEEEEEEEDGDNSQIANDEDASGQVGHSTPQQQGVQKDGQDENEEDVFKESDDKRKDDDVDKEEYAAAKKEKTIEVGEIKEHSAKRDNGKADKDGRHEEGSAEEDRNEVEEPKKEVVGAASSRQSTDKNTLSVMEIVKKQNSINNSKTADANKDFGEGYRSLTSLLSGNRPSEISRYSCEQKTGGSDLFPVSKSANQSPAPPPSTTSRFLSAAATAALADLARSHIWSSEDSKRDEDKEVPRKTRSIQARKLRRSTQGVTKEDVDRAEASLQEAANRSTQQDDNNDDDGQGAHETKTSLKELRQKKDSDLVEATSCSHEKSREPRSLSNVTNKREDVTLMLYRRGPVQDSGLLPNSSLDEDESKLSSLERRQRKRELHQLSHPARQEHVEEAERNSRQSTDITRSSATSLSSQPGKVIRQTSSSDEYYKMLFEKERLSNELISQQMKRLQRELEDTRLEVEHVKESNKNKSKLTSETGFNLTEKRGLERKIAELEEEFKNAEALKTDNQRLKEENAALIRVISKLSK